MKTPRRTRALRGGVRHIVPHYQLDDIYNLDRNKFLGMSVGEILDWVD